MPTGSGNPFDSQLTALDAASTIELCDSLSANGESGGLDRSLMRRVARFALDSFPDTRDVLLAVARMYQAGGSLGDARATLLRAHELAPEDEQVERALARLDESEDEMASSSQARVDGEQAPRSQELLARFRSTQAALRAFRDSAPPPLSERTPREGALRAFRDSAPPPLSERTPRAFRDSAPPPLSERTPHPARLSALSPRLETSGRTSTYPPAPSIRARAHGSGGEGSTRARLGARANASRIDLFDPDDEVQRIGRYEILGRINTGKLATIYLGRLAEVSGSPRLVAIKCLHAHLTKEESIADKFLVEARLASRVRHPHVVPVFEFGTSEGVPFLVMELIEGDSLAGVVTRASARGRRLPPGVVVRIVLDALEGLHAAHQLKDEKGEPLDLVHRDCTPQNILLNVDGSALLSDFGIARGAAELELSSPGTIRGKVGYLSPEQAAGQPVDRRSDVFTMGIVLWELLAGRPLFRANTDTHAVSHLLSGAVPSLRSYAPDLATSLDEVASRAMQREPERRYPSAVAMAQALERAAESLPGGVGDPKEVANFLEELMGPEIEALHEAVRTWIADREQARRTRVSRTPPMRISARAGLTPVAPRAADPTEQEEEERAVGRPQRSSAAATDKPAEVTIAPEEPPAAKGRAWFVFWALLVLALLSLLIFVGLSYGAMPGSP